jgi:hypothetical protein
VVGKVTLQVRGIDELKRELARLNTAVAQRLSGNAAMAEPRVLTAFQSALGRHLGMAERSLDPRSGKGLRELEEAALSCFALTDQGLERLASGSGAGSRAGARGRGGGMIKIGNRA